MDKCECYKWGERFECRYFDDGRPYGMMVGYNYCSGTKECDACSCGGDKSKCDFYPEVKKKALYRLKGIKTNADRIRKMTDEELAKQIFNQFDVDEICRFCIPMMRTDDRCDRHCTSGILNWLRTEIK